MPQKYYLKFAYIFPDCMVTAASRQHEDIWLLDQFPIMSSTEWERSIQTSNYWAFEGGGGVHK